MAVFFSADTHFRHTNIIRYCCRPFASVTEMDETLIANWNAVLGVDDDVWHLGDFAYCRGERLATIFHRLNGRKRLVVGKQLGADFPAKLRRLRRRAGGWWYSGTGGPVFR